MSITDDKKTIFGTSPFVVMEQEEADLIAEQKKKAKLKETIKLDKDEADIMAARRLSLESVGTKVTQGSLNSYVLSVPELVNTRQKLVNADSRYTLAKSLINALDHQKDCLVQISANKRAEAKLFSTN